MGHKKSWGRLYRADTMAVICPQGFSSYLFALCPSWQVANGSCLIVARWLLQLQTVCPCPRQEEARRPKDQSLSLDFDCLFQREALPGFSAAISLARTGSPSHTSCEEAWECQVVCLRKEKERGFCEWLFHSRLSSVSTLVVGG